MGVVMTLTPHQKIDEYGYSSQWEGVHTRFDNYNNYNNYKDCYNDYNDGLILQEAYSSWKKSTFTRSVGTQYTDKYVCPANIGLCYND